MSKNRKTSHRKRRDLVALQHKIYKRHKDNVIPSEDEIIIVEEDEMSKEETTISIPAKIIPMAGPIANPLAIAETFMIAGANDNNDDDKRLTISVEEQLLTKESTKELIPTFDATIPSTPTNLKQKMQASLQTSDAFINLVESCGGNVSDEDRKKIDLLNSVFRVGGKTLKVNKDIVKAENKRLTELENTNNKNETVFVKKSPVSAESKPKSQHISATATIDIDSILDSAIECETTKEITVEDTIETSNQHYVASITRPVKPVRPTTPVVKQKEKPVSVSSVTKREVPIATPKPAEPVKVKETAVETPKKKNPVADVVPAKKSSVSKPLTKAQMRALQKEERLAKIKATQEAKAREKAEQERIQAEEKAKEEARLKAEKIKKAQEEAKAKAAKLAIEQEERKSKKTALLAELRALLSAEKENPVFTDTHQVLAMDKGPYIIPPKAETNIDDLLFALDIFEDYLSNTVKELDILYEAVRQCDMETTDLLHVVELDNLTAEEQKEFLEKLREVRSRRRTYKVRQTYLTELKTFLDNTENIIPKINGLSLKLATVLRRKENAIYAPRIRTDIKETDSIRYLQRPFGNQKGSVTDD